MHYLYRKDNQLFPVGFQRIQKYLSACYQTRRALSDVCCFLSAACWLLCNVLFSVEKDLKISNSEGMSDRLCR